MKRLKFLVEGQTEAKFVTDVLTPYFSSKGIMVEPPLITWTSRDRCGKKFKGGVCKAHGWNRVKSQLARLMSEERDQNCLFTTMFDFYGFPEDIPLDGVLHHDHGERVIQIETAIKTEVYKTLKSDFHFDFVTDRLVPFVMLHEFEALVFSDLQAMDWEYLDDSDQTRIENLKNELLQCDNLPEKVNNGEMTAPSKRIIKYFPDYDKVTKGVSIVRHIGMKKLLEMCPHFCSWVASIEDKANNIIV